MEYSLLFLIVIFQVYLLFYMCRDIGMKKLSNIFRPSTFNHAFRRHQGLCSLS